MTIVGIDPGANGTLCMFQDNKLNFSDFKHSGLLQYINLLKSTKPDIVILESVHSMPGQGVKSMFSMGQRLGELEGMLQALSISYDLVKPQKWHKACNIPPKSNKKQIAQHMLKLYPQAELYGPKGGLLDGRSDALGLMHYGRITYGQS
jgi:hypothetical protein